MSLATSHALRPLVDSQDQPQWSKRCMIHSTLEEVMEDTYGSVQPSHINRLNSLNWSYSYAKKVIQKIALNFLLIKQDVMITAYLILSPSYLV